MKSAKEPSLEYQIETRKAFGETQNSRIRKDRRRRMEKETDRQIDRETNRMKTIEFRTCIREF